MFVADDVTWRPEIRRVRVARSGNQNARDALCRRFSGTVEELEAVEILEIETDHSPRAVYFEPVSVLITDGITRSLERADAAIAEARLKKDGVIHLAFMSKRVRHSAEFGDGTVQHHRCVNQVREQIAHCA